MTTGQVLKRTLTSAWPRPLLAETCMTMVAEVAAPWLSVTVRTRVWSPSLAGAVQLIVAADEDEKPSVAGLTDHAKVMVSPAFGSCAVALAVMVAPGLMLVEESTKESITGTAFLNGTEAAACWAMMITEVTWFFMMATPEVLPE